MTAALRRSTAFAPATVANVACGFDVLGLALEKPGDTVTVELVEAPGISIVEIEGDEGRLSREPERNTATVAARTMLERAERGQSHGLRVALRKGLPLASGMGSSAASAVAAALAVSDLLQRPFDVNEILSAALEGERVVAGAGHADNAAACLFGGLVLVRSTDPLLDVVRLPVPPGLSVAILRPHLEMSTRESRGLLGIGGEPERRGPAVGQRRRSRGRTLFGRPRSSSRALSSIRSPSPFARAACQVSPK